MEAGLLASEERELVRRVQSDDAHAFGELYDLYHRRIYTYLYYKVGDQVLAEDLAADVFTRALQAIGGYDYRGVPIAAWLMRIAHNLVIDHFRRSSKRQVVELDEHHPTTYGDPVPIVENQLTRDELMRAMTRLTEEQKQVIVLKFVEGMSNSEVAAVVGKPEGAIKSLQHRGLAALRRHWTKG
jgi:RNA polymerase sigma-70 factor, ECF subfamily